MNKNGVVEGEGREVSVVRSIAFTAAFMGAVFCALVLSGAVFHIAYDCFMLGWRVI